MAISADRASREPCSARGSIWVRRAETSANSAPTKNALPSSSTSAQQQGGLGAHAVHPVRCLDAGRSRDRDPVDAQAVHQLDPQLGVLLDRLLVVVLGDRHRQRHHHRVATGRDPSERLDQQAGDGVVVLVLGKGQPGRVLDLVGPEQPGDDPGAVRSLAQPGGAAVVLVGDVPDDLLDDVLQGDHAGGAAVLVGDDRHLEALATQQREQRVQPQRLGHHGRAAPSPRGPGSSRGPGAAPRRPA